MAWSIPSRPVEGNTAWTATQEAIWQSLKSFVDGLEVSHATPDLFPRKSGKYYTTSHPLSGSNTDGGVFGTSGTRVFLTPFAVTHAMSIDRLSVNVQTAGAGGSNVRLGIYAHSTSWGTANKVVSASASSATTGDKDITISSTPLAIGMYWMAIGTTDTSGSLVVRRANANVQGPIAGDDFSNVKAEWAMRFDSVTLTSDLPSTLDLGTYNAALVNDVPIIWVRKA